MQKIVAFLLGIIQILLGILLSVYNYVQFDDIIILMSIAFVFSGIRKLFQYFTMARFMVDGKIILIVGVILLDLGFFGGAINDMPQIYVIIYLVIIHAFEGLVEILRALEAKSYGAGNWKLKFTHGIVNMIIVVACIIYINNVNTLSLIYGIGIMYSGIMNVLSSFRRTTLAYIP